MLPPNGSAWTPDVLAAVGRTGEPVRKSDLASRSRHAALGTAWSVPPSCLPPHTQALGNGQGKRTGSAGAPLSTAVPVPLPMSGHSYLGSTRRAVHRTPYRCMHKACPKTPSRPGSFRQRHGFRLDWPVSTRRCSRPRTKFSWDLDPAHARGCSSAQHRCYIT